jgi:putative endonuclease
MTNRSKTLYVGVTNQLARRVQEHKEGRGSAFTSRYRINQLVYCEVFADVRSAILREKQIKGWTRAKKVALIESLNPEGRELKVEM